MSFDLGDLSDANTRIRIIDSDSTITETNWWDIDTDLDYNSIRQKTGWYILKIWWFITEPIYKLFNWIFDIL